VLAPSPKRSCISVTRNRRTGRERNSLKKGKLARAPSQTDRPCWYRTSHGRRLYMSCERRPRGSIAIRRSLAVEDVPGGADLLQLHGAQRPLARRAMVGMPSLAQAEHELLHHRPRGRGIDVEHPVSVVQGAGQEFRLDRLAGPDFRRWPLVAVMQALPARHRFLSPASSAPEI